MSERGADQEKYDEPCIDLDSEPAGRGEAVRRKEARPSVWAALGRPEPLALTGFVLALTGLLGSDFLQLLQYAIAGPLTVTSSAVLGEQLMHTAGRIGLALGLVSGGVSLLALRRSITLRVGGWPQAVAGAGVLLAVVIVVAHALVLAR
ncbi:hypothetical protein [Actinocatenispora thailandica]|uniref:hypothetical protein n=1 Tax=Actinocatenispora thailandica TaxID=227318 RepID=UPI001951E55C|nr:hypothetical protein [Actinocatenispora thailandica]